MTKLMSLVAVAALLGAGCASASPWRVGVFVGAPVWWGAPYAGHYPYRYYAYPGYYYPYGYYPYPRYYPYPAYFPYPAYAAPPPVYVQKPPKVATYSPPRRERFTLSARELFAFDRDELRTPPPKLDEIASALINNPLIKASIIGYTDRLGSDEYNIGLSQRRANAVKSYLVGRGVAADRLFAVGKGKADPVVHCDNSDHAALIKCLEPNRRVVVEPITVERPVG